jgi:hypothetical protein
MPVKPKTSLWVVVDVGVEDVPYPFAGIRLDRKIIKAGLWELERRIEYELERCGVDAVPVRVNQRRAVEKHVRNVRIAQRVGRHDEEMDTPDVISLAVCATR